MLRSVPRHFAVSVFLAIADGSIPAFTPQTDVPASETLVLIAYLELGHVNK
jgi:hypothetical protein